MKFASALVIATLVAGPTSAQSVVTHVYDALGRTTAGTQVRAGGANGFTAYVYDSAGNRTYVHSDARPPRTSVDALEPTGRLVLQQSLVSADGRFRFELQRDGNLALWFGSSLLWAANTYGTQATFLAMQANGNLVLYGPGGSLIWQSGTSGPGARLILQNDGNLVIYSGSMPLWATGTSGH